jgi:hypothetical protein
MSTQPTAGMGGGDLIPDGLGMGSEPGDDVPVGAADAEADRQRTTDAEAG